MMVETVEKYGYRQRQIERYIELHTSTVINFVRIGGLRKMGAVPFS
jgi:hypothetical protein